MLAPLLKGITLGLLLAISVGPVIFSIIKQSINNGHKGGFAFIAGVSASDITLVLMSNVFTELFRSLLIYKTPISILGSGLLIALGIYVIFFKKVKVNEEGLMAEIKMRKRDYIKIFMSGYFMNTLNPGVIAFWLLIATTFVSQTLSYRVIMFITCLVVVLLLDIIKVMAAGKIRQKLTPKNIHNINKLSGIILIGFGVALIWGLIVWGDSI
jgi:threonine/homoserine/homoserine lactone efflux protein